MYKILLLAAFLVACTASACDQGARPASDAAATTPAQPKPDNNDLLDVLQGRWQSDADSTYVLDISNATMRHINGGQLSAEVEIEVDAGCENPACAEGRPDKGWCFLEKSAGYIQCNVVLECDGRVLRYHAVGAAGSGDLSFKKL